ncbi:MAG: type II toxin-antitoxin system RelE/ParE family toxin [Pleurocapsa sp.]
MPTTLILFYQEKDGDVPVIDWLKDLKSKNRKGFAKCVGRIRQLSIMGHELRRPAADYLRDGIYELRAKHMNTQYRILYFFNGKDIAVLNHSIIKKTSAVPSKDIELAIRRKKKFEQNPEQYTYKGEIIDNG